jgi:serine/threonine-protein kinase RsbW
MGTVDPEQWGAASAMAFPSTLHHGAEVEIRCPIDTQVLGIVRQFVTTLATEVGFTPEATDQIELAVDEACANVIRHAYRHVGVSPDLPEEERATSGELTKSCTLWVRVLMTDQFLRLTIIDHGIGIRSQAKGVNSLAEFQARGGYGGLGMYIIRNFMDEVEYTYPDCGTILRMTKYLSSESRHTP